MGHDGGDNGRPGEGKGCDDLMLRLDPLIRSVAARFARDRATDDELAQACRIRIYERREQCRDQEAVAGPAAGTLLRQMFRLAPFPYDVSPEDDGGTSIHAISNEVYVFVVLSPGGRDRCFINMDGESRRSVYTDRSKVFGRFLKGALRDLADLTGGGER